MTWMGRWEVRGHSGHPQEVQGKMTTRDQKKNSEDEEPRPFLCRVEFVCA